MNIKLTLAAALVLTATPVFAQTAKSEGAKAKAKASASSDGKMTVISSESLDGDDGQQSSFEIRIEDGKVITAKRNGKEIPADQIRREDNGRIIILDENGKEIEGLNLFQPGEGNAFFTGEGAWRGFRVGEGVDGEGNGLWQVQDDGPAPKVMLGVHMTEPGAALEKHLHLKPGKCAMITGVFEGLPAEVAGIGEFDVIVRIDDSDEADASTIRKILGAKDAGDTITLRVIQAGDAKDLKVKLQPFDAQKLHAAKLIGKEPDANMFGGLDPLQDMAIDLKGLEGLKNFEGRVFVAPQNGDWQEHFKALQPQWEAVQPKMAELGPQVQEAIKEAMKNYEGAIKQYQADFGGGDGGEKNADVEAQLDRLDKRMAQLEELLGKLLEKQAKP